MSENTRIKKRSHESSRSSSRERYRHSRSRSRSHERSPSRFRERSRSRSREKSPPQKQSRSSSSSSSSSSYSQRFPPQEKPSSSSSSSSSSSFKFDPVTFHKGSTPPEQKQRKKTHKEYTRDDRNDIPVYLFFYKLNERIISKRNDLFEYLKNNKSYSSYYLTINDRAQFFINVYKNVYKNNRTYSEKIGHFSVHTEAENEDFYKRQQKLSDGNDNLHTNGTIHYIDDKNERTYRLSTNTNKNFIFLPSSSHSENIEYKYARDINNDVKQNILDYLNRDTYFKIRDYAIIPGGNKSSKNKTRKIRRRVSSKLI